MNLLGHYTTWRDKLLAPVSPNAGLTARRVTLSHGRSGTNPSYTATMLHPEGFGMGEDEEYAQEPTDADRVTRVPGGRWLSIHPQGPNTPAYPVYAVPNKDATFTIAGGAGGRLNGLKLDGLQDEAAYSKTSARQKSAEKRLQRYVEEKTRQQVLAQAQELAARRDAGEVLREPHLLPMTPAQAIDYARILHYAHRAEAAHAEGDADTEALSQLAPDREDLMSDPTEVERLHALLPQIKEEAFNRVSHAHPDGAKVRWLADFADEHRAEPMVVHTHGPQTAEMLAERLGQGGHKISVVAPYDDIADNEDERSRAILSVFPHSGTPSAHILVTSDPTVVESAPTRRFHLISHDHPYINGSEEGIAPLSIHDLAVDNNHDRVHAESSQVGADGVEKGIDGESDPKYIPVNPDAGKYNTQAFRNLRNTHEEKFAEPDGQMHDMGTVGDYLVGPKIRALYQEALHVPVRIYPMEKDYSAVAEYDPPSRTIGFNTNRWIRRDEFINGLLHEAAHAVRHAKGRGADLDFLNDPDEDRQFESYRNSAHERSARRMANYARLQLDEGYQKGLKREIKEAAKEIDPDPSHHQIRAGNYKKAHIRLHGLDITLENKRGSTRRGVDPTGKHWHRKLTHHYGYIRRVGGVSAGRDADGDHTDVFIGPHVKSQRVFVVDQVSVGTHAFDEHKVLLGFRSVGAAKKGYLSNYDPDWKGLGAITEVSLAAFKAWLRDGGGNKKPFAPESELKKAAVLTDAFHAWFGNSQVRDEAGTPKVVYHGTNRADRIGNRMRAGRATSGPMPYFTEDPQIASSYAVGKPDNSLETPDDYRDWFFYKPKGARKPVNIQQAWHYLEPQQRQELHQKLPLIGQDEENPDDIGLQHEPMVSPDTWKYHLQEAHQNPLEAAKDLWLNGGVLFGREEKFLDVLRSAGLNGVEYRNPNESRAGVVPAYLKIENPLDVANIPPETEAALESATRGTRRRQGYGADAWDKNTISPADWWDTYQEGKQSGNTFAWTRIPDKVTSTLQSLGYDGIKDTGGKMGGPQHTVWVPFTEGQVKSATGNKGTYDPTTPRLDKSVAETSNDL